MDPRSSVEKLPEDVRRWLERALTENGFSGYAELSEEYAGQVICFPKDYRYKIAQSDLDIYNSFNGRNWGELGRRYNWTENALRKIVKRVQDRIIKEKQPDMFI